jgi:putative ABC transport system substrate-binding protein
VRVALCSTRAAIKKLADRFSSPGQSTLVSNRILAFRSGLGAPDLREAADAEIVVRLANEQIDRLPEMAEDLVGQRVQAICAVSPPAVRVARAATTNIPITAMDLESDPVANGWAASLAHPGGNVTGVFLDLPGFNAKSISSLMRCAMLRRRLIQPSK